MNQSLRIFFYFFLILLLSSFDFLGLFVRCQQKSPSEVDDRPIWSSYKKKTEEINSARMKIVGSVLTKQTEDKIGNQVGPRLSEDDEIEKAYNEEINHPDLANVIKTKSQRKCFEMCYTYKKIRVLYIDGKRFITYPGSASAFGVGGIDALLYEFPHMVALGFGTGQSFVWDACGGSLISKQFVLTAAHCITSSKGYPSRVRTGEHDVTRTDDGADPKDHKISQIIVHPEYKPENNEYNDIALLKLQNEVVISKSVKPACLSNSVYPTHLNGTPIPEAVMTGWGTIGFGGAPGEVLQKVNVDIIENVKCRQLIGKDKFLPNGVLNTQICAGALEGGRDACPGDSGGPLQISSTWQKSTRILDRICPFEIIGITSNGRDCGVANSPGIYTRVASFIPWIESVVWPGEN